MYELFEDPKRQPADEDVIWRYMDLARFISLLSNQALYMTRSDLLHDKWEGVYGAVNRKKRMEGPLGWAPWFGEVEERFRTQMFLNSWHVSPRESAAMWDIYQREGRGVAIQTTWGRLKKSISETKLIIVGALVEYVDYETTAIPEGNIYNPFTRKRLSFEHEREARLILWTGAEVNEWLTNISPGAQGHLVQTNVETLISRVYVAPDSPGWVADSVRDLVRTYGHSFEVIHSDLYNSPLL